MSAVTIAVSALILGTILYGKLWNQLDVFGGEGSQIQAAESPEGGINILVVGSDDRTGQGEDFNEGEEGAEGRLNDVNMLVHIAEDLSHAEVVSIPRDTIISTSACKGDDGKSYEAQYDIPFNSILGTFGGMNCIANAIEYMSGIDVHYAAMVQFKGVIEMSNAVGGVEVCVAEPIEDTYIDFHLEPGMHELQGEEALKFLRTRHGVGDGSDLARISNQQVFLSALVRKLKSGDTLTNPVKLYGLAQAVSQNMTLSRSLASMDTLMSLASSVAKIPTENITFISLPVADEYIEGKVQPMDPDAENLWTRIRNDKSLTEPAAPAPTAKPNASGESGQTTEDDEENSSESEAADESEASGSGQAGSTPQPTFPSDGGTVQQTNANQVNCANEDSLF